MEERTPPPEDRRERLQMKVKECKEDLDLILALEGGELIVESNEELERVIALCRDLMTSQRILWSII